MKFSKKIFLLCMTIIMALPLFANASEVGSQKSTKKVSRLSNARSHTRALPFDPKDTALVLIDHQVGTMKFIKNHDVKQVEKTTLLLAKVAKVFGMPVVLTSSQETQMQGPLMPSLKEILPEAYENRIQRAGIVNAWTDPVFRKAVLATGKRNLIMAGVTTDVCLVFPAIDAVKEGFKVQAVLDASGSPSELSEELSRKRMENAGVVLTSSNTLIAELTQDWSTPNGQKIVQLLFSELMPQGDKK